jgi:hypothetical protein
VPYTLDALAAVVQLVVGAAVLFVVVPWVVLDPRSRRPFGPRMTDHAAAGVLVVGVLVPVLSVVGVFDGVALVAVVVALAAIAARLRGEHPTEVVRGAWRRAATLALDVAEGVRSRRIQGPRGALDATRTWQWWVQLAAGAALLGTVAWLVLGDALVHAGPDLAGHGVRVLRLDALALHRPFADGVHHLGVESVLSAISRIVAVDTPLLVRLTPGLEALALVVGVVWSGWRVTGRFAAGLVGGAFVGLAASSPWWPLEREPSVDVLGVSAAVVFVAPALAAAHAARAGRGATLYVGVNVGAIALLHPLIGALLAVALLIGWIVTSAIDRTVDWRFPLATVGGAAIGWVPILFGLAAGEPLARGSFSIEAGLGPAFREIARLPPVIDRPHLLLVVALVLAVAAVVRGPAPTRLVASAIIVLVVAVEPYRIGLDDPLAPGIDAVVVAAALGLGAAILAGLLPRGPLVAVAVAFAVGVVSLPLPDALSDRERKDVLAERIREIEDRHAPFGWTVVAEPAALTQVPADGFFVDATSFVERYDPAAWEYDPDRPDLAVPTRHVYVFVPLDAGEDVANETAGDQATEGFDDLSAGSAFAGGEELADWMRAYAVAHGSPKVAWIDDDFVVYHLERSREEQERADEQAELEREERREGATRCRTVGDDLLFPTPKPFQECE